MATKNVAEKSHVDDKRRIKVALEGEVVTSDWMTTSSGWRGRMRICCRF